jgi:hypothetical protein
MFICASISTRLIKFLFTFFSMEILTKLFNSQTRVRLIRLFLFNPDLTVSMKEMVTRVHASASEVGKELRLLVGTGLVKTRNIVETTITPRRGKKPIVRRKRTTGFIPDKTFCYLMPLQNLLVNSALARSKEMVKRLSRGGNLKMVVASGVFIQSPDSRLDLLVVGDHIKKNVITRIIKTMEADIGRELRYAILETVEFHYRASICDKLIRDVLDYPHQRLLDKVTPPGELD